MALRTRQRSPSGKSDDFERQHRDTDSESGNRNNPPSHDARKCFPHPPIQAQARPLEAVPTPVLLIASKWLAIADLLTLGTVDRSFRGLAKEEALWKAAAHYLWKSALLEGKTLGVDVLREAGLPNATGELSFRVGT